MARQSTRFCDLATSLWTARWLTTNRRWRPARFIKLRCSRLTLQCCTTCMLLTQTVRLPVFVNRKWPSGRNAKCACCLDTFLASPSWVRSMSTYATTAAFQRMNHAKWVWANVTGSTVTANSAICKRCEEENTCIAHRLANILSCDRLQRL